MRFFNVGRRTDWRKSERRELRGYQTKVGEPENFIKHGGDGVRGRNGG